MPESEWVSFIQLPEKKKGCFWAVVAKSDGKTIGLLLWQPSGSLGFFPEKVGFSFSLLREIADFCETETRERAR